MPALLSRALGDLIRWGLTILATYLVTNGIWSQADATEYVAGATIALVTLVWAVWQKYKDRLSFLAARQLPVGASGTQIREKAQTLSVKAEAWK